MMNMQKIARTINNYHNQVQANRINQNMNKFKCHSNRKKLIKNKLKSKKK